jgi:hypothetical protein
MAGSADATTDFLPFQMGSQGLAERNVLEPRINFYLAGPRLTGEVDHGTPEFTLHHERCLVAPQRKLTLQK